MSAQVDTVYTTVLFSSINTPQKQTFFHSLLHTSLLLYLDFISYQVIVLWLVAVTMDFFFFTTHNPCIIFKKSFPSEPQVERLSFWVLTLWKLHEYYTKLNSNLVVLKISCSGKTVTKKLINQRYRLYVPLLSCNQGRQNDSCRILRKYMYKFLCLYIWS